ncbi:hypothetical protein SBRCBS47491_004747 [Sporothrix bragantina]|uniref:Histidine acid phosphatase n=1 Tax=Sporothrix bragantina TaxID=671064 RepID=A0ABP0BRC3_9PEZI
MTRSSLVLGLLAAATAAPVYGEDITVWSAVVYNMYGERTPLNGATIPALTPLGAQEMYTSGTAYRNRYVLEGTANASLAAEFPISGLETNALDTTQVSVLSTDDSYVAAGALAFLQGLYPPQTDQFAYDNGGRTAAVLANGALVNFPLDGYQYPLVSTYALQDPMSSWIEGHLSCSTYQESYMDYRYNNEAGDLYNSTLQFYQELWPKVFQDTFSEATTNFYNAYNLYDYASYQYNHNPQTANSLSAADLHYLELFAAAQQRDLNANLTVSGNSQGDMVRAVAGRMLAQEVVTLFKYNMLNAGANYKMSLLFGSFEPMLAFFALSGLMGGPSADVFMELPGNAASMVFELYSLTDSDSVVGNDTVYPSPADLHVRFLYSPDSSTSTDLAQYGLFVTANDTTSANMTWTDFAAAMQAVGIESVAAWCSMCDGVSVFCAGELANVGTGGSGGGGSGSSGSGNSSGSSKSGMAPAVAGVIGALVTLAVIGLVVLAAMLLGGLRFFFAGKKNKTDGSGGNIFTKRFSFGGSGGGFKGSERKTVDADVAVSNAGVGHERVGSWELRGGASSPGGGAAAAAGASASTAGVSDAEPPVRTERIRSTIVNSMPDDDDEDYLVGDLGHRPVDPHDHV